DFGMRLLRPSRQWLSPRYRLVRARRCQVCVLLPAIIVRHRADVTNVIGPWGVAQAIKQPVDADLLLRAAAAGTAFVSTGAITVHKFATGSRYLAYARQDSQEQALMARMMVEPDFDAFVAAVVARARAMGTFGLRYPDFANVAEGEHHRQLGIV